MREAAEDYPAGTDYQMAQSITDDFIREQTLVESARIGELGELRLVDRKKSPRRLSAGLENFCKPSGFDARFDTALPRRVILAKTSVVFQRARPVAALNKFALIVEAEEEGEA